MKTQSKQPPTKIKYAIGLAYDLKKRVFYRVTRKPLPFPRVFEIQTNNLCNGACLMCPISKVKNNKPERMSDELFEKIIKDIAENGTDAFVLPFLQNEPLMDNDLFKKLKLIKRMSNGKIATGFVTNGTLFTKEKIKELCEAGVDDVFFSIDASTEETYSKIRKGLNYNRVLENIENLRLANCKTNIIAEFLLQKDNYSELNDFKEYWGKKGIKTFIQSVNNRAGTVSNFRDVSLTREDFSFRKNLTSILELIITGGCWELIDHFNVLCNGDVILCCNDYSRRTILGNVKNNSIKEIWNSQKYQSIREAIFNKDFEKIPECRSCSQIKYF